MAKIFDLDRFLNRHKNDQPFSKSEPELSDSKRKNRNKVLPIDIVKGVSGGSWPAPTARTSLNAGAGLLLVIGVLCGLYLGRIDEKTTTSRPGPDAKAPMRASTQPSMPARSLSKPSPAVPAEKVQDQDSTLARQPSENAPSIVPAMPIPRYMPTRYEATHKKVFGGCTGHLELTSSRLHFTCPNQSDLNFPIATIAKAHKDGIELKSGEKYHFSIANRTKEQVEAIFISWLSTVQTLSQANRAAAF